MNKEKECPIIKLSLIKEVYIMYTRNIYFLIITVPKSAQDNTSLDILSYTDYAVIIQFNIPVCIMYIIILTLIFISGYIAVC